jgi:hypothetical protein
MDKRCYAILTGLLSTLSPSYSDRPQVLIFCTMTRALDVIEELMDWRGYRHLRCAALGVHSSLSSLSRVTGFTTSSSPLMHWRGYRHLVLDELTLPTSPSPPPPPHLRLDGATAAAERGGARAEVQRTG